MQVIARHRSHSPANTLAGNGKWSVCRAPNGDPLTPSFQRCDGAKPACQQCLRAKKPEACQYDDGKGKTRTQLLRENIERLEQRIRELEDPEYTSPSVTLHDPHFHRRSESSSSSLVGSPGSTGFSAPHSPLPPSGTPCRSDHPSLLILPIAVGSPQHSWIQGIPSPSPTPFSDAFHIEQQPPLDLAQML